MREAVFTNIEGRKIFTGFIKDEVFEKEITERSKHFDVVKERSDAFYPTAL